MNHHPDKQEFQKFLEKSGVIDLLTKVLVRLYETPERPSNAVDYIKEVLNESGASKGDDTASLKARVTELEKQLAEKEKEIAQLKGSGAEAGK